MRIGQAQDLPLQGWCRRASVGATLVVARCVENTAHGHLPIARTQFTKTSEVEDPLLKVPPARRGNRTHARFPSRSGGNLTEGGIHGLCSRSNTSTQSCASPAGGVNSRSPVLRSSPIGVDSPVRGSYQCACNSAPREFVHPHAHGSRRRQVEVGVAAVGGARGADMRLALPRVRRQQALVRHALQRVAAQHQSLRVAHLPRARQAE
jgi:hypothetical protein